MNHHPLAVEVAQQQLLEQLACTANIEYLPIDATIGKILAMPIHSPMMVPPTDIAMMDGYALHHEDAQQHNILPIEGRITAGDVPQHPLKQGTACRIFTGAMLPDGADTVIKQEDTIKTDDHIQLTHTMPQYRHIRRRGEEITQGQAVLPAGIRLTPASIGLCASLGLATLPVFKPLKVALLVTGSELVEPGNPLPLGKIYNANQHIFLGLLNSYGFEVVTFGIIQDRLETIVATLRQAQTCDVILTTGGVSVGEEDHIRHAIKQLGGIAIWQVDMKPGRPFAFGHVGSTPIFGLPGKPAAAFTTFHLFVLPALLKQQGATTVLPNRLWVTSDFSASATNKREYLSVQLNHIDGYSVAHLCTDCIHSSLLTTARATGFVLLEAGQSITPNSVVPYLPLHFMN